METVNAIERAPIHLLMEESTPLCAYTNKALADADCWTCNEGSYRSGVKNSDYWVKTIDLVVDETTNL